MSCWQPEVSVSYLPPHLPLLLKYSFCIWHPCNRDCPICAWAQFHLSRRWGVETDKRSYGMVCWRNVVVDLVEWHRVFSGLFFFLGLGVLLNQKILLEFPYRANWQQGCTLGAWVSLPLSACNSMFRALKQNPLLSVFGFHACVWSVFRRTLCSGHDTEAYAAIWRTDVRLCHLQKQGQVFRFLSWLHSWLDWRLRGNLETNPCLCLCYYHVIWVQTCKESSIQSCLSSFLPQYFPKPFLLCVAVLKCHGVKKV